MKQNAKRRKAGLEYLDAVPQLPYSAEEMAESQWVAEHTDEIWAKAREILHARLQFATEHIELNRSERRSHRSKHSPQLVAKVRELADRGMPPGEIKQHLGLPHPTHVVRCIANGLCGTLARGKCDKCGNVVKLPCAICAGRAIRSRNAGAKES